MEQGLYAAYSSAMRLMRACLMHALILGVACSRVESTEVAPPVPLPVDHDAQGSWGIDNHGAIIPGNSFVLNLYEFSGTIIGNGSFAFEAGPWGTLSATGSVAHDSLQLQIVYAYELPAVHVKPDTTHFAGVLTTRDQIDGRLTRAGSTSDFDMLRLPAVNPP